MKILVTGGAGFIGSNFIIEQIKNKNNEIINYDKLTYAGNLNSLDAVKDDHNYTFIKGDILDSSKVKFILDKYKPNIIVNFAAESHVDRSIDGPLEFINTNIVGTSILLNESMIYFSSLKNIQKENFKFLHISTDEVYGSLGEEGFFSEHTPYAPTSPYSASKASSDHLVRAWHHTYGLPVMITNCSNNYGPFQFPEKLIPLMIIKCLEGKKLPIYGDGENIRDWLFVKDHCNAIYKVLTKGKKGETYNVGGGEEIKNIDIVKIICEKMDTLEPRIDGEQYKKQISFVKDRPGHDFRYAINAEKIKNKLGWEASVKFSDGIEKTIKWYLENKNWWMNISDNKYNQERLGAL